jgi:hypothetical protein
VDGGWAVDKSGRTMSCAYRTMRTLARTSGLANTAGSIIFVHARFSSGCAATKNSIIEEPVPEISSAPDCSSLSARRVLSLLTPLPGDFLQRFTILFTTDQPTDRRFPSPAYLGRTHSFSKIARLGSLPLSCVIIVSPANSIGSRDIQVPFPVREQANPSKRLAIQPITRCRSGRCKFYIKIDPFAFFVVPPHPSALHTVSQPSAQPPTKRELSSQLAHWFPSPGKLVLQYIEHSTFTFRCYPPPWPPARAFPFPHPHLQPSIASPVLLPPSLLLLLSFVAARLILCPTRKISIFRLPTTFFWESFEHTGPFRSN